MNADATVDGGSEPETGQKAEEAELKESLGSLGKKLAAGFGAVTALFTFAGIDSGGVQRILRNESQLALAYFVLIGLAIGIGLIASLIPMSRVTWSVGLGSLLAVALLTFAFAHWANTYWSVQSDGSAIQKLIAALIAFAVVGAVAVAGIRYLAWQAEKHRDRHQAETTETGMPVRAIALLVGLVFFIAGIYGAFRLAAESIGTKERPELTATIDGSKIQATIKSAGLRSDEHMLVVAYGRGFYDKDLRRLLYASRTGSKSDGTISQTFEVRVPPAYGQVELRATLRGDSLQSTKRCDDTSKAEACLLLSLPSPRRRPSLSIAWGSTAAERGNATVTVQMPAVAPASSIEVVAWRPGEEASLYHSWPVADKDGVLTSTFLFPAGKSGSRVCVVAAVAHGYAPESEKGSQDETGVSPSAAHQDLPQQCPATSATRSVMELVVPS